MLCIPWVEYAYRAGIGYQLSSPCNDHQVDIPYWFSILRIPFNLIRCSELINAGPSLSTQMTNDAMIPYFFLLKLKQMLKLEASPSLDIAMMAWGWLCAEWILKKSDHPKKMMTEVRYIYYRYFLTVFWPLMYVFTEQLSTGWSIVSYFILFTKVESLLTLQRCILLRYRAWLLFVCKYATIWHHRPWSSVLQAIAY